MIFIAEQLIPLGILILQIAGFFLLISLLFARSNKVVALAGKHATLLAFLLVLGSTAGSLFYSNVIGFTPCYLCWWQRVFIYPQVLIFGAALWRGRTDAWLYALPLIILGTGVSIYQNLLPLLGKAGITCAEGALCTKLYVNAFGYITIPLMALSTFAILILLAIASRVTSKRQSLTSN